MSSARQNQDVNKISAMAARGVNDSVITDIFKKLGNGRRADILDLGSGQGYNAQKLTSEGNAGTDIKVTCVDIDGGNFKLSENDSIKFIKYDLNSEFEFGKFDFVIATEIIEHLENPYSFIRSCLKNLKTDGRLYITSPNIENIYSMIRILLKRKPIYFQVNEPSGHIMPVFSFMVREALRRIDKYLSLRISYNRNVFPIIQPFKTGKKLITVPGNNRFFGEVTIYEITRVKSFD